MSVLASGQPAADVMLADGTRYACESSANLRSCKNVETFMLACDFGLYEFHKGWIEGELLRPRKKEERDD